MPTKQWEMTLLFEGFVQDSYRGKRLKKDGKRIKPQTADNYRYVLLLLREYEATKAISIRIKEVNGRNKREWIGEQKYWNRFYLQFTNFLYGDKHCFDNYVGNVVKIIRIFFAYLKTEKLLQTGDFYKRFYVCREEIPIHTLLPEQLKFLITDVAFHDSLTVPLKKCKDIFVFGCTVALRFSDLMRIKRSDIEYTLQGYYLSITSLKTETATKVKLPDYAIAILLQFIAQQGKRKRLLPSISKSQFNKNIRLIAERAGWVQGLCRWRSRRGTPIAIKKDKKEYRFCDHVSSHTMRRTAVTMMLMLGMQEHIVRKISGHSANSKAFYRYVNVVQSYLDNQTDQVFNKLAKVEEQHVTKVTKNTIILKNMM